MGSSQSIFSEEELNDYQVTMFIADNLQHERIGVFELYFLCKNTSGN